MSNGRDREFLRNLTRYAGESYTGDLPYGETPTGDKWFEDFQQDAETAFYTTCIDELKNLQEQVHPAYLTEDEILTFVKYLAKKLGNQRSKKREARELLKGKSIYAPAGARYKWVLLNALRVSFGIWAVYKATERKMKECAEVGEIFGEALWEQRHSSLLNTGYYDMADTLLLGATTGELRFVRWATEKWDVNTVVDVP